MKSLSASPSIASSWQGTHSLAVNFTTASLYALTYHIRLRSDVVDGDIRYLQSKSNVASMVLVALSDDLSFADELNGPFKGHRLGPITVWFKLSIILIAVSLLMTVLLVVIGRQNLSTHEKLKTERCTRRTCTRK
uniref:Uncharacterized protein n=1 Tax=Hyaloperonospora arabidopsidis (strain Emoy2) TaxID=559515 RepID=M4BB16_HYAAE